jgi:hypothetical protein
MLFRRIAVTLAALAGMIGLSVAAFAAPASAGTTNIVSPIPTGLVRLCIGAHAVNTTVCLHL